MGKKNTRQKKVSLNEYKFPLLTKQHIYISIGAFLISFLVYANTIPHGYALDDVIVLTKNSFTQKGFAGFIDILTKDSFQGFTSNQNLVSGGRYRPLSILTFAAEVGLFGKDHPYISHFINVLLFAISMVLMYLVCFRFIFKGKKYASIVTTLIFIVHPLHTEVVANIKGRDEILAMLFGLATIYLFFKYLENKTRKGYLIWASIVFFLSLISKENAVLFIVFIPLILYFFYNKRLIDSVVECKGLIFVLLLYLLIRFTITGIHSNPQTEILNAPYLLADPAEAFATKVYILLKYLLLLFFPYPLSCLYTWNAIPYIGLDKPEFVLSLLIYLLLFYFSVKGFKSKKAYSFFILNYLIMIMLVSNFIFDIGALMGDRFLFQPGFPVILAGGYYVNILFDKLTSRFYRIAILIVLSLILGVFTFITFQRNKIWDNDDTLAIADRDVYNSAILKHNAATGFFHLWQKEKDAKIKDSLYNLSLKYADVALAIYPTYVAGHITLGSIYFLSDNIDSAASNWEKAEQLLGGTDETLKGYFSVLAKKFYERAQIELSKNEVDNVARDFEKTIKYDTTSRSLLRFYYDKALVFISEKDLVKAKKYLEVYLKYKKDDPQVNSLYTSVCNQLNLPNN